MGLPHSRNPGPTEIGVGQPHLDRTHCWPPDDRCSNQPGDRSQLLLSRATVRTHVAHILTKLGARTRAESASIASRHEP